jgi:large subunit GTPase 1
MKPIVLDDDDDEWEDEDEESLETKKRDFVTVGLVGYPNVGKSSTINALMTVKKVSTSATPGKTKHFQTIFLDESLCLCDCPGLVFPNFVSSKAHMIVNGILSIDEMTDHVAPVNLICAFFSRKVLAAVYGINLKKEEGGDAPPLDSEELLSCYGFARGFMTARGLPNQPRTARLVLKDFVNGRLVHCVAPPGFEQRTFHEMQVDEAKRRKRGVTEFERRVILEERREEDFDDDFFRSNNKGLHVKDPAMSSSFDRMRVSDDMPGAGGSSSLPPKGFKRAMKRNKNQKLRNIYAHHDI